MRVTRRILVTLLVAVALCVTLIGEGGLPRAVAAGVPSLASYAPPDSIVFFTMRTDDAFINALNGLVQKAAARIREIEPQTPVPDLRVILQTTLAAAGLDFKNEIRPTLGDHAALFIGPLDTLTDTNPRNDMDTPAGLILDIKDRRAAIALVEKLISFDPRAKDLYTKADEATYTTFRPSVPQAPAMAVNDNALIVGTGAGIDAAMGTRAKLFEQANIKDTLALLPEQDYNMLLYLDTPALAQLLINLVVQRYEPGMVMFALPVDQVRAALEVIGPTAVGATLLDNRSLTLDSVQRINNPDALKALGLPSLSALLPALDPVDPAFTALLPADTSAVIHATNLAALYRAQIESLRAQASLLANQATPMPNMPDVEAQIKQAIAEFEKRTGLNLDTDVLSWLTGDWALIARYTGKPDSVTLFNSALYPGKAIEQVLDLGLVIEATDPAKAQKTTAGLAKAIREGNTDGYTTLSDVTIDGVNVLLIKNVNPATGVELEAMLGANDKVFFLATRKVAEELIAGKGGLDGSATLKDAQQFMLKDPVSVLYADSTLINLIGDVAAASGPQIGPVFSEITSSLNGTPVPTLTPGEVEARLARQRILYEQAAAQIRLVSAFFTSASITAQRSENGDTVSRAVLTLDLK